MSDVTISLTVKVDPPSTALPLEYSHCMVGTSTRFSTTVPVQLRVYISPAVVLPVLWMATSGTGRSRVVRKKELDVVLPELDLAVLTLYSEKMCIAASCAHDDKL